jgi:chloramphenicol O-acetyltransferase type A
MGSNFELINMDTWARTQTYQFYMQYPTSYSVTFDFDVTILKEQLKKKEIKFFPTCLYLVSKTITSFVEFRMAIKAKKLGYYDCLHPQYSVFHEDNKTFSLLWTEYKDNFEEFYKDYLGDTEKYGQEHNFITSKGKSPQNSYVISCSPWLNFNSVSLHMQRFEGYLVPMFFLGAFRNEGENIKMPISITMNHAAADGYNIKLFIDELQRLMNNPEVWL